MTQDPNRHTKSGGRHKKLNCCLSLGQGCLDDMRSIQTAVTHCDFTFVITYAQANNLQRPCSTKLGSKSRAPEAPGEDSLSARLHGGNMSFVLHVLVVLAFT